MNSSGYLSKFEQKENKQSHSEAVFSKSSVLRKHENIHGDFFIPLQDGETVAFIEGGFDHSPTAVILWHIPTDTKTELNHKNASEDTAKVKSLTLSHDGNYLIASVTRDWYQDEFIQLLVWDLKNKILQPCYKLNTQLPIHYTYRASIVTENNLLMIHFTRPSGKWENIVTTYSMSDNGALNLLNVVTLDPKSYIAALSLKNLIFEVPQTSNQLIIRDYKGTILENYFLKSEKGTLNISRVPLMNSQNDNIYSVSLIDNNILSLIDDNEAVYIVDATDIKALKQIAYVNYDLIGAVSNIKCSCNGQVETIPMSIETGVILIENKGTILFYHLKEQMFLGMYRLGYQKDSEIEFKGAILNNRYLVCSQYEDGYDAPSSIHESISLFKIDLLEELIISKIARELFHMINYPFPLVNLIESYMVGSNQDSLNYASANNPSSFFSNSSLEAMPPKICGKRKDRDDENDSDSDIDSHQSKRQKV